MTSSFSISASVKVRAFGSFLGENTSASVMYVAVTGLWSENLSSVLPYLTLVLSTYLIFEHLAAYNQLEVKILRLCLQQQKLVPGFSFPMTFSPEGKNSLA
ncbi:hypothetical protein JHK87_002721 [Glycine soja]|nr:hypothetical protein JHK87_002721 [Glycine soja]